MAPDRPLCGPETADGPGPGGAAPPAPAGRSDGPGGPSAHRPAAGSTVQQMESRHTKPPLEVKSRRAYVPDELLSAARQVHGGIGISELIRRSLAIAAGLDPNDFPVRPQGHPPAGGPKRAAA